MELHLFCIKTWICIFSLLGIIAVNVKIISPRTAAGKTQVSLVYKPPLYNHIQNQENQAKMPNSDSVRQKPQSFHSDC